MNASSPTKSMIGRSVLVAAVFCVLLVVGMGGMLFYHQIIKHDFYETRALEQQTLDQIITPARGTIYSSDMQKLAYSVPCYTVVLSPATMKDEQVEKVASELAVILDLDREWILQKTQNKKSYYQVIKKKVDSEICNGTCREMIGFPLWMVMTIKNLRLPKFISNESPLCVLL